MRIVGGDETEVNEYPWQVWIISTNFYSKKKKACVKGPGVKSSCGGIVIGDQWVLTAGHCVDLECDLNTAQVEVHLGEHKTNTDEDDTIQMDVEEIIRHEKYNPNTPKRYNYDIALLKLTSKIDFGSHPHIRPICLPADGSNNDYSGYTATATGWGKTSIGEKGSPHLLEVDLTVGTENECSKTLSGLDFEQVLCAKGVDGTGTCRGDSGGPLVIKEAGYSGTVPGENYELIGVNSFGKKDVCKDVTTGFVRVTAKLDWIREKTKDSWRTCPRT